MPRQKSLRCVETVLFLGLFILVGHLGINFWERYMIQNEVNNMKFNLYRLKDTIGNIGRTYDNLQSELKAIMRVSEMTQVPHESPLKRLPQKRYEAYRSKDEYNLDKTLRVIQERPVFKAKEHEDDKKINICDRLTEILGHEDKKTGPMGKNATTMTRYPLQSVGVTSDISEYEIERYPHKCRDKETYTADPLRCCRHHRLIEA